MIAEPDVALTDYALVVETFIFTVGIYRLRSPSSKLLKLWFLLLFASIGVAALVGGTVHGFLTDPRSPATRFCWVLTLILLGITALSEYGTAAQLLLPPHSANLLTFMATLVFLTYVAVVVLWNATFRIAVIDYLGGLIFLLIAFVHVYFRRRSRAALVGIAGLLLTVAASVVQQAHISLNPRYFNHNALYHLVEAIALFLIYRAGRSLVNIPALPENR